MENRIINDVRYRKKFQAIQSPPTSLPTRNCCLLPSTTFSYRRLTSAIRCGIISEIRSESESENSVKINQIECWIRNKVDVIASLRLWVQLNSDNYSSHMLEAAPSSASSSSTSSSTGSTEESSAIILSQEAIRNVLEALTKIPVLDIGDWTTVLRSLTWLSSPRWLLTDPCPDPAPRSDQPEELADQMCAGTVIRSPHLTRILYNFISGQGLLPFSLGDKQLVSWIYCSIYKPQQIIIQIIIFYYDDIMANIFCYKFLYNLITR